QNFKDLQNQNFKDLQSENFKNLQKQNTQNSLNQNSKNCAPSNDNLNRSLKYRQIEYADNIEQYLHAADLVVTRAGATAVFELSALKCKALFVPLPKGVSRGDQIFNADLAKEYGGNILLQDKNFDKNFVSSVNLAFKNPPMRVIENDANRKIAEIICDTIRRGELWSDKKQ
ncbi:MAG: glycosyltransferase, partial [Clostridia bacterium]